MGKTIFDHLKGISKDKIPWDNLNEDDKKSWDDYMITRWLSMNPEHIVYLNELQILRNSGMHSKDYYNLLFYSMPKKYSYFKYIKKPRTFELKKELLHFFSNCFKISKRESLDLIEIISILQLKDEFESLMAKYGLQEDEKEKLRKDLFDGK